MDALQLKPIEISSYLIRLAVISRMVRSRNYSGSWWSFAAVFYEIDYGNVTIVSLVSGITTVLPGFAFNFEGDECAPRMIPNTNEKAVQRSRDFLAMIWA